MLALIAGGMDAGGDDYDQGGGGGYGGGEDEYGGGGGGGYGGDDYGGGEFTDESLGARPWVECFHSRRL